MSKNRFKVIPFNEYDIEYYLEDGLIIQVDAVWFPGRAVEVYDRLTATIWIECGNKAYAYKNSSNAIEMFMYRLGIMNHNLMRHSEFHNALKLSKCKSVPRSVRMAIKQLVLTDYGKRFLISLRGNVIKGFYKQYGYGC